MKTLTIILLIAANSLLAAPPPPTPSPTPASMRPYSSGIVDGNCNRNGQGPVIKDSPGTIITIHAAGLAPIGVQYWVLLFNKTTAPVNGDVPAIAIPYVTAQNGSADRDYPGGLPLTTGISWALSTSPFVLNTVCTGMTLTVTYQ
jgi:hypothetical protein